MTIGLTEAAAQHLRRKLTKRGHGTGLSVATKKSGGKGFAHVVDCADNLSRDDQVFESQDV
jgi:iron-sulfur cluster assembly protein